jgi:hypothetical protein
MTLLDCAMEESMRQASVMFGLSVALLLFGAGIAANLGKGQMPEMRGAWVAQALR